MKKGGHVLGYALLGASYWRALEWNPRLKRLAWLMAVGYAVTDELHQVLVAGRHASAWDVILFDAPGALIGLWIVASTRRPRIPPGA